MAVTGKSGRGTARQTIRVDETDWQEFGQACDAMGTDRSAVLRTLMRWYTHRAELPDRPESDG